ncbi:MAG: TetR/AcrR family transcriptional regulator [Henriciella sp.]
MESGKYPMREKRKAESRASLIKAAQKLFSINGYEETTLDEVAEEAGLHVQTLYRHFANKQELATAGVSLLVDEFRNAIQSPDRSANTFDFWRGWLRQTLSPLSPAGLKSVQQHASMLRGQALLSSSWHLHMEYEDLLTESFAADFGMSSQGVGWPRLVAGMLTAGNMYVIFEYSRSGGDVEAEALKVVDLIERQFGKMVVSETLKLKNAS